MATEPAPAASAKAERARSVVDRAARNPRVPAAARDEPGALQLRDELKQLFRRFQLLRTDSTPCGKPLSPAHAHALMLLRERGELSQQALGNQLGLDKSNVARLCARMAELGQAEQRTPASDGRARLVSLLPRGEKLADEVDRASRARFQRLFSALPKERRQAVLDALGDLTRALSDQEFDP